MTNFAWRNALLSRTSYTVSSGEHHLSLQRCYRNPEGTPVLMLAGFGQSSQMFWGDEQNSGLAPFLADIGFDVYIAECRGKGVSWPQVTRASDWGLHQLITEDIPAHLSKLAKLRPGEPQFWVGHGLGSLLLAGCYARLDILPAPLLGMVHFAAGRRCQLDSFSKALGFMGWQAYQQVTSLLMGQAGINRREAESTALSHEWQQWLQAPDWLDPFDAFDYRAQLRRKGFPSSLYFSVNAAGLWGSMRDTRLWVQELGNHDAQLVGLSRKSGNLHNYSSFSMLTHGDACEDHFVHLQHWLAAKQPEHLIQRQFA